MKRWLHITLVLVFGLAVASMQPAAAANTAVGNTHTTDTDFNNATLLDDVVVSGSGSSASVELGTTSSTYNPVNDEGDGTTDTTKIIIADDANNNGRHSEHRIQPSTNGYITQLSISVGTVEGSNNGGITVDVYIVQESPDGVYGEGTLVRQDWTPSFSTGTQTFDIQDYSVSSGTTYTIEFVTSGSDSDGSWDYLGGQQDDSASSTWFTNDVGGGASLFNHYSDITVTIASAKPSGTYISQNHNIDDVVEGTVDLELTNAEAIVTWQQNTGSGWSDLNTNTYTTGGTKTTALNPSTDNVRVNVTFQALSVSATARLNHDQVSFQNNDPTLDDQSAEPQGDPVVSQTNPKLNISVSDQEFSTPQGESVDVEFFVNGSSIGTDTLNSNGTAEVTWNNPTGGPHQWHAEASDSYGGTASSDTFFFQMPGELEIRNETNPGQLINDREVTVRFYPDSGGEIVRTTNDGTVSLSGVPTGETVIATASTTGYFDRRIAFQGLVNQQTIYLLNNTANAVQPIFDYQDFTGRYPQEDTIIQIQRLINGDWRTVEGDYAGATGSVPAQLLYNVRHRIRIENTVTGDSRILGAYTPVNSGVKQLRVFQSGGVIITSPVTTSYVPEVRSLSAESGVEVGGVIRSENDSLTSYNVSAVLRDSSGTQVLFNLTGSQVGGERLTQEVNLSGSGGGTVTIRIGYSTGSASVIETEQYGVRESYQNQYSLLAQLQQIPGQTAASFTTLFAVLASILLTAAVASSIHMSTEAVGLVGVGFIAGFTLVGWAPLSLLFVVGVAWVAFTALVEGL